MNANNKDLLKELGLKIRDTRMSRSMKQGDFCSLLGVSRSHVSNIESGRIDINITTFFKICEILAVYPNHFSDKKPGDHKHKKTFHGEVFHGYEVGTPHFVDTENCQGQPVKHWRVFSEEINGDDVVTTNGDSEDDVLEKVKEDIIERVAEKEEESNLPTNRLSHVDQIKGQKKRTESQILGIVRFFEESTGMQVDDIDFIKNEIISNKTAPFMIKLKVVL